MAPEQEIGSEENAGFIILIHDPSGIQYRVEADGNVTHREQIASLRAKAKLAFMRELHGDA